MKVLPYLILVLLYWNCNKKDNSIDTKLPKCIQNIIDDKVLSTSLKTVRVQNVKGDLHYWLNTDFTLFDGAEYIVNMNCDTVCNFCGRCIPMDCINNYPGEKWQIIWQK